MLDPSWSSMAASTSSSIPASMSSPTATESASSPHRQQPQPQPQPQLQTEPVATTDTNNNNNNNISVNNNNNNNNHSPNGMNSSMVSESSGSTSSWIQVEQTLTQVNPAHTPSDNKNPSPNSDDIPSTTTSAIPSPSPSPYPSLPPEEDAWSHDELSLGDDEGLASSISSLSSLQGNHQEHEHEHEQHITGQDDTQQHAQEQPPPTTAASLGASTLGVSSITSSWHDNFQSLHDATNDHDSPPLSTTSSPLSSATSHSLAPSPRPDMTSSTTSYINVSTPTLVASTLAASTLAATTMATSMVQPHVTSVDVPSPSLYPQSDHDSVDDTHHSSTGTGAILIATMCGLFLGFMASSYYFSRRSHKRGLESRTTIATLQRLLSEKDAELKRVTELFQQYLATPIVVRLTER